MNTELLIVVAIIILSSLYATDFVKKYNPQVVFVLACLIIVLLYKFVMYRKINDLLSLIKMHPESFQSDFSDRVNDFLNRADTVEQASPAALQEYQDDLTELRDKVDIMNGYLSDLKTQLNTKTVGGGQLSDQYNIQASQQIQDYQIKKLTDDIQRANDLIKEAQLVEDAAKYKKIPLMNSCIIQQADGSVSIDTTLQQQRVNTQNTNPLLQNSASQLATQSNTAQQNTTVPGALSAQHTTTSIRDLLQMMVQNGINVSIKQ
jgi:hypothetical protein